MLFAKLLVLDLIYTLSGDALYSPFVDKWVHKKRRELHLAEAKTRGAKWLLVVWEVRSLDCRYIQIFDQEEHDMWEHRLQHTEKVKTSWNLVEKIVI